MLLLTRKIGERVAVGDHIWIKVVGIEGKRVQIGIEAPRNTPVFREELYEQHQAVDSVAEGRELPTEDPVWHVLTPQV